MSWRTVVITSRCKLDLKMGYLVIRGMETKRIFLDEIAILMIESTAVSLTAALLAELTEKKVRVILCDGKRQPAAELTPYCGCHDSSRKIREQIAWDEQRKGLLWTRIIAEKIRNQAKVLRQYALDEPAEKLLTYAETVEFADTTNREGHAAKVYFNALFGMDFSRRVEHPINAALNYGYSLLLSVVNREVSANGYLTQLGLFHDNGFNQFNLSCDLMEPFRPIVDRFIRDKEYERLEAAEKHEIVRLLQETLRIEGKTQTLLYTVKIYVKSVFDALSEDDIERVKFPEL